MLGVDQIAEDGIRIEARQAEPVDGARARYQGRAARVAEQGIVSDRWLRQSASTVISVLQLVDKGRQLEVPGGQSSRVMADQLNNDASPADLQVRMVALRFGDRRQAVDKPDRSHEVVELERPGQLAVLDLPASERAKAVGDFILTQLAYGLWHTLQIGDLPRFKQVNLQALGMAYYGTRTCGV